MIFPSFLKCGWGIVANPGYKMVRSFTEILERASQPVNILNYKSNKNSENLHSALSFSQERMKEFIKYRSVLDPKRHYKEKCKLQNPIHIGAVIDDHTDFYSSKTNFVSKKGQNKSFLDSLIKDENKKAYFTEKFGSMQVIKSRFSHKNYQKSRNQVRAPWNRKFSLRK